MHRFTAEALNNLPEFQIIFLKYVFVFHKQIPILLSLFKNQMCKILSIEWLTMVALLVGFLFDESSI